VVYGCKTSRRLTPARWFANYTEGSMFLTFKVSTSSVPSLHLTSGCCCSPTPRFKLNRKS